MCQAPSRSAIAMVKNTEGVGLGGMGAGWAICVEVLGWTVTR